MFSPEYINSLRSHGSNTTVCNGVIQPLNVTVCNSRDCTSGYTFQPKCINPWMAAGNYVSALNNLPPTSDAAVISKLSLMPDKTTPGSIHQSQMNVERSAIELTMAKRYPVNGKVMYVGDGAGWGGHGIENCQKNLTDLNAQKNVAQYNTNAAIERALSQYNK